MNVLQGSSPDLNAGPAISVVVPAYNSDAHISTCLESLTSQTLRNLEIIVVNDGSSDNTRSIVEEWANRDTRIRLISTDNRGVSSARNTGIARSRGTFVTFVDADDWVESRMYERLLSEAGQQGFDSIACDLVVHKRTGSEIESASIPGGPYSVDDISRHIYPQLISSSSLRRDWPYRIVTKLFRREVIEKHDIRFEEDLTAAQDFVFSVTFMLHTASLLYVKGYAPYHYEWNDSSRTRSGLSSAWENYRKQDKIFQELAVDREWLTSQVRLAELHGDLSSFTYLYRGPSPANFWPRYRLLVRLSKDVDRTEAFRTLAWTNLGPSKFTFCSLYRYQILFPLHLLLTARAAGQSALTSLNRRRGS